MISDTVYNLMGPACFVLDFAIPTVLYIVLRRRYPAPAQRRKCVIGTILISWLILILSLPLGRLLADHYLYTQIPDLESHPVTLTHHYDLEGNAMLQFFGWLPAVLVLPVLALLRFRCREESNKPPLYSAQ